MTIITLFLFFASLFHFVVSIHALKIYKMCGAEFMDKDRATDHVCHYTDFEWILHGVFLKRG